MSDYELNILSQDKRHLDSTLKIFNVDDEKVIGVEKQEPFKLLFKNNSSQRVQVRLSVDGTDVLTGETASTKPSGKMFVVEAHSSMSLHAWPETLQGGGRFVFTTEDKSVAVNTHGNKAGIGLIAAAVYVDYHSINRFDYGSVGYAMSNSNKFGGQLYDSSYHSNRLIRKRRAGGASAGNDVTKGLAPTRGVEISNCSLAAAAAASAEDVDDLAVGVGEFSTQQLQTAAGLSRPVLDDVIQVRYEPWAKLQKKLAESKTTVPKSNAFPGDKKQIDLSNVPRTKTSAQSAQLSRF